MELFQFIYEVLIFWNPFLNKPNDAVFVDKVSNPSPTVEFLDRFIFVGNKWKPDTVLSRKFTVRFHTVGADADELRIQFFKFFQIPLEGNDFIGSDRRKYSKIKRQHDVFLALEICQLNFSLSRVSTKQGGFVAHIEPERLCRYPQKIQNDKRHQQDNPCFLHLFLPYGATKCIIDH